MSSIIPRARILSLKRHSNDWPCAYLFSQPEPDFLRRPSIEVEREHFARTVDFESIAFNEGIRAELLHLKRAASEKVGGCKVGNILARGFAAAASQTVKGKPGHQIVKSDSGDVVSLPAMIMRMNQKMRYLLGDIAVAVSAPIESTGSPVAACSMQRFHDGMIAATVATDYQRLQPHLFDQGVEQGFLLLLKLTGSVLEFVIAVVAVHGDAEQFALVYLLGQTALRVDCDFKRRETETPRGTCRQPVEVRTPDGADQVGLRKMA